MSDDAKKYTEKFLESINDDLNVSEGLALVWEVLKDEKLSAGEKIYLVNEFNNVLGLDLDKIERNAAEEIPAEVTDLANQRKAAKANKDFKRADEIRQKITEMGYEQLDKKGGEFEIKKK